MLKSPSPPRPVVKDDFIDDRFDRIGVLHIIMCCVTGEHNNIVL